MNLESTLQCLFPLLKFEEGLRLKPYLCPLGYPTIGYGMKIGPQGANLRDYQFRISERVAQVWLEDYVQDMLQEIYAYPQISRALAVCNEARAAVILSMCFQMGVLGVSKFVNTLDLIIKEDWVAASAGMMNSKWAKQTAARAGRHSVQMQTGKLCPEYV